MDNEEKQLSADTSGTEGAETIGENLLGTPEGTVDDTRRVVEDTVEEPDELSPDYPPLAPYKIQYESLPDDVQDRCAWENIAARLLSENGKKLKLAQAMQGGGELFGVDREGRALFKDKGVEPVMYGFNVKGEPMQVYDRDPEQMKQIKKRASCSEIRDRVREGGYELFPGDILSPDSFGDEMTQAQDQTKQPFVASKDEKELRISLLSDSDNSSFSRNPFARFDPVTKSVCVYDNDSLDVRDTYTGAVRLLRV